jgi:hypothetical protein
MRRIIWIVLALVVLMAGSALAQDVPPVFCGELAAEDCALLERSRTAMYEVNAAAFDLSLELEADDPGRGDTLQLTVMGSGAYSGFTPRPPSMTGMTVEDLVSDLTSFRGELSLQIVLPQTEEGGRPDTLDSVALELRLVDGVGYINFDALQPFINDPSLTGWGGLDIAGLLETLAETYPEVFAQMSGGLSGIDAETIARLTESAEQYMTVIRTDSGTGASATFETSVDLAGLYSDPAFTDMMRQQMQAQMDMDREVFGSDDLDEGLAMLEQMFQDATLTVTQTMSATSGLIESIGVAFDMSLSDAMSAMEAMAESNQANSANNEMSAQDDPRVTFNLLINFRYDDLDEITAPEDVSILPFNIILQLLGGFGTQPDVTPIAPMTPTFTPVPEGTPEATLELTPEVTLEPTLEVTVEPPIEVTPEATVQAG